MEETWKFEKTKAFIAVANPGYEAPKLSRGMSWTVMLSRDMPITCW